MAKKHVSVSLRKPPPVETATFSAAVATARDADPSELALRGDTIVVSPRGRELRELTIYLPPELARQLALHCMDNDRDTSKVLAEMIERHLQPGAPADAPEVPDWRKLVGAGVALLKTRLLPRWA